MTRFLVPTTHNAGIHWFANKCMDVNSRSWISDKLSMYRAMGFQHVKLTSSEGGDDGWSYKELGCTEWTFKIALELGMQVTLRLWGSTDPPYWTQEKEVCLRRFVDIAKGVAESNPDAYQVPDFWFACEPANEIDVYNEETGGGGVPTPEEAAWGFVPFCYGARELGVYPLVPSVGYGGPNDDYLTAYHTIGEPQVLDDSGVAIHPYAGAFPITPYWPWHDILVNGTPITQEEFDSYHPWCWDVGSPDERSVELVNQWREEDAEERAQLTTTEELYRNYNYGWYTLGWAKWLLDELGHPNTELYLTECGTRVGEKFHTLPRIDPNLHKLHTLSMIAEAEDDPRIAMTAHWLFCNMKCAGNKPNWEDQAWESWWLDQDVVSLPWPEQIDEPGFLPIVTHLRRYPAGGKMLSKLYFHVQEYRDDVKDGLREGRPCYVKLMGNALNPGVIGDVKAIVPGVKIIGRYHVDPSEQIYLDDPEGRAISLVDKIEATGCGPLVWAWEDYNEVPTSHMSTEEIDAYDRFMAYFHHLIDVRFGVTKTIVINSPTGNLGWPNEVSPSQFQRTLGLPGTVVSFHCYERWKDPGARPAFLFRWKELKRQVDEVFPHKEYLLTETGVTKATIPGQPDVGWRVPDGYTRQEYMGVLVDLDGELKADYQMLGACVFQTGAKSDWATFESVEEVTDIRREVIMPPNPDPPVYNNAEEYGVYVIPANVKAGEEYWKAVEIVHLGPCQNRGNHNFYFDVVDEMGERVYGTEISIHDNYYNHYEAVIDKPLDEPGANIPIYKDRKYEAYLPGELESDEIEGVSVNHPDEICEEDGEKGNTLYHHSFLVKWQKAIKSGVITPEDPVECVREEAWNKLGVDYNPDAAFTKYARVHNLGKPEDNEFDAECGGVVYRIQPFSSGIVFAPVGQWGATTHIRY